MDFKDSIIGRRQEIRRILFNEFQLCKRLCVCFGAKIIFCITGYISVTTGDIELLSKGLAQNKKYLF